MLKTWKNFNAPMKLVTLVYLVTFIHHIYGGIIYNSPDRLMAAAIFTVFFALTWWAWALGQRGKKIMRGLFWALAIIFWVVLIGIYEGGYNHTLYLALWYGEPSHNLLSALYPQGGDVKVPNSFIFEATGVLTFVAAMALMVNAIKMVMLKGKQ